MDSQKDKNAKDLGAAREQFPADITIRFDAPSGLDLHPEPKKVVRVSWRAGGLIVGIGAALLLAYAYGGYRRTARVQRETREADLHKSVAPATQAETEFTSSILPGALPLAQRTTQELQPPGETARPHANFCGVDPRTNQPYRYDPQTGQPCNGLPYERVVVRQAPIPRSQPIQALPLPNQPNPEEQRLIAAYEHEQEAKAAPTIIRGSEGLAGGPGWGSTSALPSVPPGGADLSQLAALRGALGSPESRNPPSGESARAVPAGDDEFSRQNMQAGKEAFLSAARNRQTDDYLQSARDAPLSRYEIKAGWEIPAVLEQNLNSDLPGELKALVSSNVYDTATGMYLLIPQGSRLIGKYDSRVSYGQDGVQVAWSRIIYPDASSIDLDGMVGFDAHGNAGLRDKIDHHYTRLFGLSALTSVFTATFAISQRANQSVLAYPTPGEAASQAVGQEVSQTGSQITRRNLNVQPTIKVPVGYKFVVRVNRDILFETPYEPVRTGSPVDLRAQSK